MCYDIFISYRRKNPDGSSNVSTARTLLLKFQLLGFKVFFDYSECQDDYFSDTILPAIDTCKYFLLLVTPGSLERCNNEGDWVRREIEEALKYKRKIVPVTPDDKLMDCWPDNLPESLSPLSFNGGLQITTIHMGSFFDACIEQLIRIRMQELRLPENCLELSPILKKLEDTLKEVNEKEPYADFSKGVGAVQAQIIESNAFALEKLKEIAPYLMETDRDKLMTRLKDIEERRGEFQVKMASNPDFSNDDVEIVKHLIKDEIELKHEFKDVLSKEIEMLVDSLRDQN